MTHPCALASCFAPEVRCVLGHDHGFECPKFRAGDARGEGSQQAGAPEPAATTDSTSRAASVVASLDDAARLPWTGNALGTSDLAVVSARSRPRLIGLFGGANAGKTTLLAMWYLLLQHGERIPDRRFAGSLTLQGWENLAHWLRWKPAQAPTFPPHTSAGQLRVPGLLHLAFRSPRDTLHDVLITDPPGEWFRQWSLNRDASEAAGARWMAEHADVAVLVVDCAALVGPERGGGRDRLRHLAWRVGDELRDNPVAVVWTKADVPVDPDMKEGLRAVFRERLPNHKEFAVSVPETGGMEAEARAAFMTLLQWLVDAPRPRSITFAPGAILPGMDPLLAFRLEAV